ncbi:MAG TPA: hypothetical protein VHJ34_05430 [Actinomycetota bacterium]|nr:hypothetical protein [Actinomycetota bacterium]
MGTVSAELRTIVDEAAATDPAREVPVIVTLARGADAAALEGAGLTIGRRFAHLPGVSGTVRADAVDALAGAPGVELVEFDGEVWALGDSPS